jgi:hypothetical protein
MLARLLEDLDVTEEAMHEGFCVTDRKASEYATHFVLEKAAIQS